MLFVPPVIPKGYETRLKIVQAIAQLAKESNDIDKVSVVQICERAGVSRPTFYSYFSDKYEAIQWYVSLAFQQSLALVGHELTFYEGIERIIWMIDEDRDLYSAAYVNHNEYYSVTARSEHALYDIMMQTIKDNGIDFNPTLQFQLKVWGRMASVLGAEYTLPEYADVSPEEYARMMTSCIPRELLAAMDEPVLKRRGDASGSMVQR